MQTWGALEPWSCLYRWWSEGSRSKSSWEHLSAPRKSSASDSELEEGTEPFGIGSETSRFAFWAPPPLSLFKSLFRLSSQVVVSMGQSEAESEAESQAEPAMGAPGPQR